MELYNVWALERNSGEYRSFVMLEESEDAPDTVVEDHEWVRIARLVSKDEAESVMNQYPHVARAKC